NFGRSAEFWKSHDHEEHYPGFGKENSYDYEELYPGFGKENSDDYEEQDTFKCIYDMVENYKKVISRKDINITFGY
ncbi:7021_t:CDS:2, partial [Scutellospora calospora]